MLALAPDGAGANLVPEVIIDVADLFAQPVDMLAELVTQRLWGILDGRSQQAVLLGGQHLLQLPPATDVRTQRPSGGIWQGTQLGLDGFGKASQHLRVEAVGFGELAGRSSEVTHLAGIDDNHGQLPTGQVGGDEHLEPAGHFESGN